MSGELNSAIRAAEAERDRLVGGQRDDAEIPDSEAESAADEHQEAAPEWSERDENFARGFGWVPREEWTGPPDKWIGADAFAEKKRSIGSTVDKLERRLAERERELRDAQARQQEEVAGIRRMLEAGHKRQIDELKEARRLAILDADADRAERIDAKIDELRQPVEQPKQQPGQQSDPPEVSDFKQRHASWFLNWADPTHAEASEYAIRRSNQLAAAQWTVHAQIDQVEREIGQRFGLGPHAQQRQQPTPKPAAPTRATVDGGSTSHAARLVGGARKKTFSDLPRQSKNEFDDAVSVGLYQDNDADRQLAADAYFDQ